MSTSNSISVQIPSVDQARLNEAISTIREVLQPHLVTISTVDRRTLPKMNEKTLNFVKKTLEYAQSHPEFTPAFLNVSELKIDLDAFETLTRLGRPLEHLSTALTDTTIVSGSEAYTAALSYYQSVKQAVKLNIPNAKVIHEDLKVRFEDNGVRAPRK